MLTWKKSFAYKQLDLSSIPSKITNETQRIFIKNNLFGNKIKLKFSNIFGTEPLVFDQINIALSKDDVMDKQTVKTITFNGSTTLMLNTNEEAISDEIDFKTLEGFDICITTYHRDTNFVGCGCTMKCFDSVNVINTTGNHLNDETFEPADQLKYIRITRLVSGIKFFYGLSDVFVYTDESTKTICAFGDSIVHHSFWTGPLTKFLYANHTGKVSLFNKGISGNRVLRNGAHRSLLTKPFGKYYGEAGISRFNKDIYSSGSVDIVIVFHGLNDIMLPYIQAHRSEKVTAREIIVGYLYYYEFAKKNNSKIFLCTMTPFKNYLLSYNGTTEQTRQEANEWIRTNSLIDGYFDFDKILKDEQDPHRIKEHCHIGDNLHMNKTGGYLIASEVYDRIKDLID